MSPAKIAAAIAQARAINCGFSFSKKGTHESGAVVALDDLALIIARELEAAHEIGSVDGFLCACGSDAVSGMAPAAPATTDGSNLTIHFVRAGISLCRMPGAPRDWPANHLHSLDVADVNCPACSAIAKREAL